MSKNLSRALVGSPELIHTEMAIDKMLAERPEAALRAHRHPSGAEDDPAFLSVRVLLLKINQLEEKVDRMSDLVRQLSADRYPRYVGTREACKILGIGSTTMDKRLQAGYYPFAFKENGRWRFLLSELYKFAGQL